MSAWLVHRIEEHATLHRLALRLWRAFPPRLAGYLKGKLARNWLVGAVAVMVDTQVAPPQVLLVEHSYRTRGAWGLPGGSLESIPGDPTSPDTAASPDDAIEANLRREVLEELSIAIEDIRLLRIDAVPYMPEEPGPYRLDFYFRCRPAGGFAHLREELAAGRFRPNSPEILQARLVALDAAPALDLFSADARFLAQDLPRLLTELASAGAAGALGSAGEAARAAPQTTA